MGAPLSGSNLRASVLTGGGLYVRGLRPKVRARRLHQLFPLTGSSRRGLVSVECKKKQVGAAGGNLIFIVLLFYNLCCLLR